MSSTVLEAREAPVGIRAWHSHPTLFEINSWVWLNDLSSTYGRQVTLASVPSSEWNTIAAYGFDSVWLMGVWRRSPAGTAIANNNKSLLEDFKRALPDFRSEDNVGSPYCVRDYVVDEHLGGPEGLATARRELANRGLNLVLDFVPNHVAPDHLWVVEHPEFFIRGNIHDLTNDPSSFAEIGGTIYACGRDPYFPAWPDVLQLDAFNPGLRQAVIRTLCSIAEQCDGVRCDMAMLMLNSIFERTWGGRAGARPSTEYWVDVISAIKKKNPSFIFIAEAYWDLEWELQQHGFDFCYDKRLYDRLEHSNAESVRLHLCADLAYQAKLLRFIENHDEPRAAATFSPAKERAAAVVSATLPGIRMLHEGQLEGRKVRLPVFLDRLPDEHLDHGLRDFYSLLLRAVSGPVFKDGDWRLCETSGWPDNQSFRNIVAWTWQKDTQHHLIVVNLSDSRSQGRVRAAWGDAGGKEWSLTDVLSGPSFVRGANEMISPGLYVELGPWGFHFFQCSPA